MLSRFSHVQLFATLWTVAREAPLSMGFSRQECWSGLPFPSRGIFPTQGLTPISYVSCTGRLGSSPLEEPPGKIPPPVAHSSLFSLQHGEESMVITEQLGSPRDTGWTGWSPRGIAFPADLSSCQMQASQGREETTLPSFSCSQAINTVNSDMLETESAQSSFHEGLSAQIMIWECSGQPREFWFWAVKGDFWFLYLVYARITWKFYSWKNA